MPDSKYGRVFIENDVIAILEAAGNEDGEDTLNKVVEDVRLKFNDETEPLFVLRGRDKRALAAVRYYRDNQSSSAPQNHLDGCDKAVRQFEEFRSMSPEQMREPD